MFDFWPEGRDAFHLFFGWGGTILSVLIGLVAYGLQIKKMKTTGKVDDISPTIALIPLFSFGFWFLYGLTFPFGFDFFCVSFANSPGLINTWRMAKLWKKYSKKSLFREAYREIKGMLKRDDGS